MNKHKLFALPLLLMATVSGAEAQEITAPSVKTPTTFAIIIDSKSYDKAREAVDEYRQSVEADGLGTYLAVDDWKSPQPIRELLQQWHNDKKAPLEGCVLVGDVPIAMVRDAQHFSSAFKMDQEHDWKESSIPSDRYYDDFDLTFDYLKQDSTIALYHYFTLRADSKQYLSPDIYSARIKPLELEGVDKYELLRKFLKKAVALKKEDANNVVDKLTVARGNAYNSEDQAAWAGEQLALREQLPAIFLPGGTSKFLDFDFADAVKGLYLNEVQAPGLDIMLYHHHGSEERQYLNSYPKSNTLNKGIEGVKFNARSEVSYLNRRRKMSREAAIDSVARRYGIPREWCANTFDKEVWAADSIIDRGMDIYTTDIHGLKPQARFVLFDACYNGSFHVKDYVAGAYIFSEGRTIATIGCTVNTIQDKWPDEFYGLMGAGMRVGHVNRMNCFLENHMSGDPTYRFASNAPCKFDINEALVLKAGNAGFWKKQLKHEMPDVQALALRQLSDADYPGLPELLEETYFSSPSFIVRLQAMRLLYLNYPEKSERVITAAINDGYELIRRFATEYCELHGSPKCAEALVSAYLERGTEMRMNFRAISGLDAFDAEVVKDLAKKLSEGRAFYDRKYMEKLEKSLEYPAEEKAERVKLINSSDPKRSRLKLAVRRFRNGPYTFGIDLLTNYVTDTTRPKEVRVIAAEALGWYGGHYLKQDIIDKLNTIRVADSDVQNELTKTLNRLTGKRR
ncbi:MAG: HEAT repeat domain-containing protein [Bacteroides sp.]|nr:HEAT repeat domain-containing protein [Bacteroides sp.]